MEASVAEVITPNHLWHAALAPRHTDHPKALHGHHVLREVHSRRPGGQTMGNTVSAMFQHDHRLLTEAEAAFPQSPAFAAYLAERVLAYNGSLAVLRSLIVQLMQCVPEHGAVDAQTTARLALDDDGDKTTRLYHQLPLVGVNSLGCSIALSMNLAGTLDFEGATSPSEVKATLHTTVDRDHMLDYLRVFVCAAAMLKGLELDSPDT